MTQREDEWTGPRAEDPRADLCLGHPLLIENPFPTEHDGDRPALRVLTTVLLVRVILTVIVPIAYPRAADALAIVTVKVKRGAGGQH